MDTRRSDRVDVFSGAAAAFGVAAVLGGAALYNKNPGQALVGVTGGLVASTTAVWLHCKQPTRSLNGD